MANEMKQRKTELMTREIEKNSDILAGKRWIEYALIVWLASRVLFHVVDFICISQDFWAFSPANLIGFLVSVFFAYAAYSGVKMFAILPIAGGLLMLYQCFTSGSFEVLMSEEYYTIIRVYAAAFVLASLIQIVVFVLIILNKKARAYFDAVGRVSTTIVHEGKSL